MRKSILLLVGIFFLTACVPFPHYERVSPKVFGTVSHKGVPVSDAKVFLEIPSENDVCIVESQFATITDSVGRFWLPSREEFRPFLAMDPVSILQICIWEGDNKYLGWFEQKLGAQWREMVLECDLENEMHYGVESSVWITRGICNVVSQN